MGKREKAPAKPETGAEAIASFELRTGNSGSLVDPGLQGKADESTKGSKDSFGIALSDGGCYALGNPVEAFFAVLKPAPNGPAWLITPDLGTHEFSRVYYSQGTFTFGPDRPNRLGPEVVERVEYKGAGQGLQIRTTKYFIDVPQSAIQSVVWSR